MVREVGALNIGPLHFRLRRTQQRDEPSHRFPHLVHSMSITRPPVNVTACKAKATALARASPLNAGDVCWELGPCGLALGNLVAVRDAWSARGKTKEDVAV